MANLCMKIGKEKKKHQKIFRGEHYKVIHVGNAKNQSKSIYEIVDPQTCDTSKYLCIPNACRGHHGPSTLTFCADTARGAPVYGINGDIVRFAVKRDGALLSTGRPLMMGAGAIPGPGGTPGPLVSIPEGVTPGPPLVVDRTPGTPGPVGGTTPGPARRGEYPSGIPSFGSTGDGLRGSGKGPVDDEEDGSSPFIAEIKGEVVETDVGGARGGDVVSGRGNCDSPFGEKRCGTGVWKRSGECENGPDGTLEFAGPGEGPGVQPCRGEEPAEEMV